MINQFFITLLCTGSVAMFGRGGNRPGCGRRKLVKTPLKKVYYRGQKALQRRQARSKYLNIGKELVRCIRRGDTSSDQYTQLTVEYARIQKYLGLQKNDPQQRQEDFQSSILSWSSDEVRKLQNSTVLSIQTLMKIEGSLRLLNIQGFQNINSLSMNFNYTNSII